MSASASPRSLRRAQVADAIRDAILTGRHDDGERLIEEKLAGELKTSRGPVREALRQLEHEGFVRLYPYKGAVVLGVSDEEVREVLVPVRLVLERFSFLKAAELMTDDDFAELAKQVWVLGEAARANDLAGSVEADVRFHELVLEFAGQPHTAQVWRSIAPRIRTYFFRYGRVSDLTRIAAEHADLLAALQTRDSATIVPALEAHIAVEATTSA